MNGSQASLGSMNGVRVRAWAVWLKNSVKSQRCLLLC